MLYVVRIIHTAAVYLSCVQERERERENHYMNLCMYTGVRGEGNEYYGEQRWYMGRAAAAVGKREENETSSDEGKSEERIKTK